jgi:hypothetical protein
MRFTAFWAEAVSKVGCHYFSAMTIPDSGATVGFWPNSAVRVSYGRLLGPKNR